MASHAYILILAMLALGLVLRRLLVANDGMADTLNRLVLNVCLPAAVLIYAPRLSLDVGVLALAAVPWLLLLPTVLLVSLLSRTLSLRADQHAVLLLTVGLGNTSFLGYPLVRALLGEAALPHAVVYDQLGAFLMLSTFGLFVLLRYGSDRAPTLAEMFRRIIVFPPLLALLIGLTVMPERPVPLIADALAILADALLPLSMLAVGLSLRWKPPREELKPLLAGLMLKLAIIPLIVFLALAPMLKLRGLAHDVAVLESAMPSMITAAAMAISHRLAPGLAAAMAAYGVLLSLVTVPMWALLLETTGAGR